MAAAGAMIVPHYLVAMNRLFSDNSDAAVFASIVGPPRSGKTLFGLFLFAVIQTVFSILALPECKAQYFGYHMGFKLGGQNPKLTYILDGRDKEVVTGLLEEMEKYQEKAPLVLIGDEKDVMPYAERLYLFIADCNNKEELAHHRI